MKNILDKDKIKLTVIISPFLKPYNSWGNNEMNLHKKILSILDGLQIRYFDLTHLIDNAIKDGIKLQDYHYDIIHPSSELGLYFSKYLYENRIFESE